MTVKLLFHLALPVAVDNEAEAEALSKIGTGCGE
jgi:hypothetical protein